MKLIKKIEDKLAYAVILAQGTELQNPIGSDDFESLVKNIGTWVQRIAIPIAVIFIVWAGLKFVTAQGSEQKIREARNMLLYVVVGLAIIFIGGGFISLIQSILSLK